jgi:hypothetical protein
MPIRQTDSYKETHKKKTPNEKNHKKKPHKKKLQKKFVIPSEARNLLFPSHSAASLDSREAGDADATSA